MVIQSGEQYGVRYHLSACPDLNSEPHGPKPYMGKRQPGITFVGKYESFVGCGEEEYVGFHLPSSNLLKEFEPLEQHWILRLQFLLEVFLQVSD